MIIIIIIIMNQKAVNHVPNINTYIYFLVKTLRKHDFSLRVFNNIQYFFKWMMIIRCDGMALWWQAYDDDEGSLCYTPHIFGYQQ